MAEPSWSRTNLGRAKGRGFRFEDLGFGVWDLGLRILNIQG